MDSLLFGVPSAPYMPPDKANDAAGLCGASCDETESAGPNRRCIRRTIFGSPSPIPPPALSVLREIAAAPYRDAREGELSATRLHDPSKREERSCHEDQNSQVDQAEVAERVEVVRVMSRAAPLPARSRVSIEFGSTRRFSHSTNHAKKKSPPSPAPRPRNTSFKAAAVCEELGASFRGPFSSTST